MNLFVLSPKMEWISVDADDFNDSTKFRNAIRDAGFDEDESKEDLIISDEAFSIRKVAERSPGSFPLIVEPKSIEEILPEASEMVLVSQVLLDRPFVRYGGRDKLGSVPSLQRGGFVFKPDFPYCFLKHQRYWRNIGSFKVDGPQNFERMISSKEGMSRIEQRKLSASLGVKLGSLSASISGELQSILTISSEKTVSEKYSFRAERNFTISYTLWQLIERLSFVNSENQNFRWEGSITKIAPSTFPSASAPVLSMRAKFDGATSEQSTSTYFSSLVTFDSSGDLVSSVP